MKLITELKGKRYQLDLDNAISLAIPVKFNGEQPNHFASPIASSQPLSGGGFIGDTKQGGSCNVDQIKMVPHCNGTHTESIHHIVDEPISIGAIHSNSISHCLVLSVTPKTAIQSQDSYIPELADDDHVIDLATLQQQLAGVDISSIQALAFRTLPNQDHKLSVIYSEQAQPPFFTREAMQFISDLPINHLLVDFPSLDKMYDQGHLSNHHTFWKLEADSHQLSDGAKLERTVTEMIYISDQVSDGFYALSLQLPAFELDAAPSRPLLYPLIELT
ncbi:cyclase family protein [Kangiella sp. TOML190]|uniref:cyclase family protein n=1 Tax=Kangiella sp. TOML190 TaxID=2931351 RepID=UPI00203EE416|nr:cyclase family protein [Kangiella sp. TOML190]